MSDRLAELYVEITAKTDKLQAGLASVKSDTAQMSAGFSTATKAMAAAAVIAGAIIVSELVGAIVKATVAAADMADAILDTSMITGISTKQIQKYKLAADMEGKSFESVTTMVKFYSAALNKAEIAQEKGTVGASEQAKAFRTLNIDLEEFNRLTTGEQLDVLLPKLMAMTNINDRMVVGQALLGKGFLTNMDIINTYVSKGGEISKLVDAFAPTQEQLERAAQLKEAMGTLQFIYDSLAITMAGPLAEAFTKLEPIILKIAKQMSEWLNNPENIAALENTINKLIELGNIIMQVIGFMNNLNNLAKQTPQIPDLWGGGKPVPVTASGGVVTSPQVRMVGEAGPEAIIPLSQMGGMGGGVTVNVGSFMGDELSLREFTRRIQRILNEESRRSSFKPTETSYYSPGGHL